MISAVIIIVILLFSYDLKIRGVMKETEGLKCLQTDIKAVKICF
jgi:hypothetical protein